MATAPQVQGAAVALALGLDPRAYLDADFFTVGVLQAVMRKANELRNDEQSALAKAIGEQVGRQVGEVLVKAFGG